MGKELLLVIIIFAAVNLTALLVLFLPKFKRGARQKKINHYGDAAEKRVAQYLKRAFPSAKLYNNVFLKTDYGLTQLDHILLYEKGIFIIETKSHHGRIVTDGRDWTQIYGDKIVSFHSPTRQNKVHMNALISALARDNSLSVQRIPIYAVTVFTARDVTFSKPVQNVIQLSDLKRYVFSKHGKTIPKHLMPKIDRALSRSFDSSKLRQNSHRKQIWKATQERHNAENYKRNKSTKK